MARATANAIGRNRNRPELGIKAKGASTSSVQQLATSSGIATSLARATPLPSARPPGRYADACFPDK